MTTDGDCPAATFSLVRLVRNPRRDTVSSYSPGWTSGKLNEPLAFVTERFAAGFWSGEPGGTLITTSTPGRTPPVLSRTTPVTRSRAACGAGLGFAALGDAVVGIEGAAISVVGGWSDGRVNLGDDGGDGMMAAEPPVSVPVRANNSSIIATVMANPPEIRGLRWRRHPAPAVASRASAGRLPTRSRSREARRAVIRVTSARRRR